MPSPVGLDIIARDRFSATFAKASAEADALGKRMTESSNVMSKAFKAVAVVAATVAGAAVAVGVESVRLASKFEDSQARLAAALKASGSSVDALKTPIAAANKRMEAFGFTNTDTADAIANLTVATKQPAKAIGLLGLAADLARFKHISLADASTTLGKAMAGNLKPIKALGIDIPVAAGGAVKLANANAALSKAQDAYNLALDGYNKKPTAANALKLHAALTKLHDAHAKVNSVAGTSNVILGILQQRLGGQAQAAAETFAGKMEVLKARVNDLGIKIGTALLPPLMKVVDWVSTHWGTIAKVFTVVGQVLQIVIKAIATGIQWLINQVIIPTVNWIRAHWPEISAAFVKAWTVIQPAVMAVWRLLQALWVQILQPLVAWVQAHWPQIAATFKVVGITIGVYLYAVIKVIQGLATVITWFVNNISGPQFRLLLHIVSGTAAAIIHTWYGLRTAWNTVFNFITTVGGAIIGWFQQLPGRILGFLAMIVTWFQQLPGRILGFLAVLPGALLNVGKNAMVGLWRGLVVGVPALITFWVLLPFRITGWFIKGGEWIVGMGIRLIKSTVQGLVVAVPAIAIWFLRLPGRIIGWLWAAAQWSVGMGLRIVREMIGGLASAVPAVAVWFLRLPGRIVGWLWAAAGWAVSMGGRAIREVARGLEQAVSAVASWFKGLGGRIFNWIWTVANWALNIGGDMISGIVKGLGNAISSVVQWFKNLPGKILSALGINSPPAWAISAGKWIIEGVLKGAGASGRHLVKFFGSLAGKAWAGIQTLAGGGIGNTPGFQALINMGKNVGAGVAAAQAYARSILGAYGWGQEQMGPLISLWNLESGWNANAYNPNGGATGIPQALPGSKMASAGADWRTNAATQIRWGLGYIKSVYGSPANAWAFEMSHSPPWYKQGAWNIARDELAYLHRGEMVVPREPAEQIRSGRSGRGGDGLSARSLAAAVADALSGAVFRFDGDGLATLVTKRQAAVAVRGDRR